MMKQRPDFVCRVSKCQDISDMSVGGFQLPFMAGTTTCRKICTIAEMQVNLHTIGPLSNKSNISLFEPSLLYIE